MSSLVYKAVGNERQPAPNMTSYPEWQRSFSWESVWAELGASPGGPLNIAEIALDRHARGANANREALRILDQDLHSTSLTYQQLGALVNRFVNALGALQVTRGAVIASFMGRLPELYVTALGAMKAGCSYCPLFSAFGPEPAKARLALGGIQVLVTTDLLYRRKIAPIRAELPDLRHVLLVRTSAAAELPVGTTDLHALIDQQSERAIVAATRSEDPALLHFTSGTTGSRKARCTCTRRALNTSTGKFALDLHPEDIFWCTADPGWVTGTSYGIIAPLACGVTSIVDSEEFDAERWYTILERERVTVWYTAPTAIRMLMKAGRELAREHDLPALRFIASVGEPLNPEAVVWGSEALGLPIHDNWWQTETGGIMIANYACDGHPTRLDGAAAAGASRRPIVRRARTVGVRRRRDARRGGRAGASARLAVDVPRLPARRGALPQVLRGRLVPDRRPGAARRGRLLLVRRPRRRRHQVRGPSDRSVRGRKRAAWSIRPSPRPASSACPIRWSGEMVKAFVSLKPGYEPARSCARELLGARAQAARRGDRSEGDRRSSEPCRGRAAARSCAGCCKRARTGPAGRRHCRRWRAAA